MNCIIILGEPNPFHTPLPPVMTYMQFSAAVGKDM